MITEQNYVGRGNYATEQPQNPQTAQNSGQIPPLPDNRQFDCCDPKANLQKAQNDLFELLHNYSETSSPVPLINDLLTAWTFAEHTTIDDRTTKKNLRQVLDLVSFLVELKEAYLAYEYLLEVLQGKEVSHV
ncbi:hypothetical protein GCM10028805_54410 [Spirosoma harenae]